MHPLVALLALPLFLTVTSSGRPADAARDTLPDLVHRAVAPVMANDHIAGMAVGVIVDGTPHVFNYGVASLNSGRRVDDGTLFELGSVSKTLTVTLTSYEAVTGHLSLRAPVREYLPDLHGSAFGNVSLINLATHTPGGLPLQVPDEVRNVPELIAYLKSWVPRYAPGTYRTYSNIGIGTLGLITARHLGEPFSLLMERALFPALGMRHTYIHVPPSEMTRYAEGYRHGVPTRMTSAVLADEAYGVRSTAADVLRFIQANMNEISVNPQLAKAIAQTHTGYFQDGLMTQDLIWEQIHDPATLNALLAANAATMIFDPTPVRKIGPPQSPRDDVWIDKTGSTNGFGAYIAFVPQRRIGIVILANENFPIPDRVTIAYKILSALSSKEPR